MKGKEWMIFPGMCFTMNTDPSGPSNLHLCHWKYAPYVFTSSRFSVLGACDLQFGNGLTLRHDTQAKREKQIWLHQNLNFCVTEDTVKTVKNKNQNHPTEQEKIPANCMSDNRLFEKIYKWPTSTWKGAWHQEPPWKCNSKPQIPLHTH